MSNFPVVPDGELYEPTDEERSSAMLPHILQIFGGFLPPLVVLIVKRQSRYVRFHSLQSLIWQLIAMAASMVALVSFMVLMFASIPSAPEHKNELPRVFFLFPLVWLGFLAQYGISILLAIIYCWQCSNGKWSRYPVIGNWALRLSK